MEVIDYLAILKSSAMQYDDLAHWIRLLTTNANPAAACKNLDVRTRERGAISNIGLTTYYSSA